MGEYNNILLLHFYSRVNNFFLLSMGLIRSSNFCDPFLEAFTANLQNTLTQKKEFIQKKRGPSETFPTRSIMVLDKGAGMLSGFLA